MVLGEPGQVQMNWLCKSHEGVIDLGFSAMLFSIRSMSRINNKALSPKHLVFADNRARSLKGIEAKQRERQLQSDCILWVMQSGKN